MRTHDDDDILERLRHPEREQERRRMSKDLFVRNILNSVFILMAAVAMVGFAFSWGSPQPPTWCIWLGLSAIVVKMFEAMLRMPGMLKKGSKGNRRQSKGGHTTFTPEEKSQENGSSGNQSPL